MSAKMNFFIFESPLRFRSSFPSAKRDGSRRRVSPQARGGGTGGREVRLEQVSSVSCDPGELPGAKRTGVCAAAGMRTEVAAGVWQESGGHGQAVAQQSGSAWQQAEAQGSAAGAVCTADGASGAAAKEASRARRAAAFIGLKIELRGCLVKTGGGSRERSPSKRKGGSHWPGAMSGKAPWGHRGPPLVSAGKARPPRQAAARG